MFKKMNSRTKILLGVLAGLIIIGAGIFIWGTTTGKLSSSASIGIPRLPSGNTGYFGNLTGKVTDSVTGQAINGASVSIACTNSTSIAGISFSGTNLNVTSNSTGEYYFYKTLNGVKISKDIKTRTETSIPINIPGIGDSTKYVYKYKFTVTAAGYNTYTSPSDQSWSGISQGGAIPNIDFKLGKLGQGTLSGKVTYKGLYAGNHIYDLTYAATLSTTPQSEPLPTGHISLSKIGNYVSKLNSGATGITYTATIKLNKYNGSPTVIATSYLTKTFIVKPNQTTTLNLDFQ